MLKTHNCNNNETQPSINVKVKKKKTILVAEKDVLKYGLPTHE